MTTDELSEADGWWSLDEGERHTRLEAIVSTLGEGWRVDGAWLVHEASGTELIPIPGGTCRVGIGIGDALALARARRKPAIDPEWEPTVVSSRPSRVVSIAPFLLARQPGPVEAPFRLPEEAELEWALRTAGREQGRFVGVPATPPLTPKNRRTALTALRSPLGLEEVFDRVQLALAADGTTVGRECHTQWQDDDRELLGLHAGARVLVTEGARRAVLPLAKDGGSGRAGDDETAAAAELVALLAEKKTAKVARAALSLLSLRPGADLAPLVEPLLSHAEAAAPKEAAADLAWLGAAAHGTAVMAARATVPAVAEVLERHVERLVAFLEHEAAAVRAAATLPLAACGAGRAAEALRARAGEEKHAGVRGSIAIAGALLHTDFGAERPSVKPTKKLAPVLALAEVLADEAEVEALLEHVDAKKISGLAWFGGDVAGAVLAGIIRAADGQRDTVAESLLASGHPEEAAAVAFGDRPMNGPMRRREELTAVQRRLLEAGSVGAVAGVPSREAREWFLGERSEPVFDTPVALSGRTLPLLLALCEIAHQTTEREAHRRRVDALLAPLALDDVLAVDALSQSDWTSLRYMPPGGQPVWPYAYPPYLHDRIAAATADERRALASRLEPEVVAALTASALDGKLPSSHPAWEPLGTLAACFDADVRPSEALLAAVKGLPLAHLPERLVVFLGGAEAALDESVDRALTVARAFVAGETRERAHVDWVAPDWPMWAVVAILAQELALGWNDTMDALSYEDELRPIWKTLPKAARKMYDAEGQPKESKGFDDPEARRPVVAELIAFVEAERP